MSVEKITKVEAKGNSTILIVVDGQHRRVDLTGLIAKSAHFSRFAEDKEAFKQVRPTKYGTGVEWANGLDLSAETLLAMSEEQRKMTGKEFASYCVKLKLNVPETAHILDTTERTVRNYFVIEHVPNTTAYTMRRCLDDNTFFLALYRPIQVAPRGRPKSVSK